MAIRQRKGRASPWEVYWKNPVTRKQESARFLTKAEAEKHEALIKYRIKYEREDFFTPEDEPQKTVEKLTLENAYLLYLKEKQFTKTNMSRSVTAMRVPLQKMGTVPVEDITKKDIVELMDYMQACGTTSATMHKRMTMLRALLRWCADKDLRPPVQFPKLPSAAYKKFMPPTPEELHSIMCVASPHIQRIVVLGAQLGVRVGPCELLQLTWADVDMANAIVRVHGSRKNVNAPWREVPIRAALLPLFEQWQAEDEANGVEYIISYRGKQVQNIKTAWHGTLQRAGITRRIRPYDLRHAFATELIASGVDVGTVASLMGHSSPVMVLKHYQYVLDDQKRSAVEKLAKHDAGMAARYGQKKKRACAVHANP